MKPYTYLIGWTDMNVFYYGVRYAKGCNPHELWITYFTSSRHVDEFRKKYGDPDLIQIRKTFISADSARLWETKFLRRIRAKNRTDFLNLTDNISISTDAADRGRSNIDYEKVGISLKKFYENADKDYIEHIKNNRRHGLANKSEESAISQSNGIRQYQLNSWSDPDTKLRRSMSMKKPKSKTQCPCCGKIGGSNVMKRWHFDNCKAAKSAHGG